MIDLYKDLGFQLNLEKPGLFSSIPTAIQSNISNAVAPQNIGAGSIIDYLQSPNFNSGITGWQVNANGDVEFNNGVFRGTLTAASGSLGAITIGTNAWHVDANGNMWWGNYATYADALIKISAAGSITFTTGNFSGALSGATGTFAGTVSAGAIISANINADLINAGTLIGRTVKATGGAVDVWMDSTDGQLKFYSGSTKIGYVTGYNDGTHGGSVEIQADNYLHLKANEWCQINYNATGGSGEYLIYNENTLVFKLDDSNNTTLGGTLTCGSINVNSNNIRGKFRSSDDTAGVSKTRNLVTSVWWDGGTLKYNYRGYTWKDGILTAESGESTANA
jgi:hypothetical protein